MKEPTKEVLRAHENPNVNLAPTMGKAIEGHSRQRDEQVQRS